MRRLLVFLVSLMATGVTLAASQLQYCADISGNWNTAADCHTNNPKGYNPCLLNIQQNGNSITSATWDAICPIDLNWYGYTMDTATVDGNGQWYVHGLNSTGAPGSCVASSWNFVIPKGSAGCATGTANGNLLEHPSYCTTPRPGGGGSWAFHDWTSQGLAHFVQTLLPTDPGFPDPYNFGGRTVTIAAGTPIANCNPPADFYSYGVTYVDSNSSIDEYVGWTNPHNVNLIRLQTLGVGSCTDSENVTISIDCQTGNAMVESPTEYETVNIVNSLHFSSANTVTIKLGSAGTNPTNQVFGNSRASQMWNPAAWSCWFGHIGCQFTQ